MTGLVSVTPSADGEAALSQIAAAKLRLGPEVALCGDAEYWRIKRLYAWLGLNPAELAELRISITAEALSKAPLLDRASAALEESPLVTERPTGPLGARERMPRTDGPEGGNRS